MNVSKKLFSGILCGTLLLASAPAQCGIFKKVFAVAGVGLGSALAYKAYGNAKKAQEKQTNELERLEDHFENGIDVAQRTNTYNRAKNHLKEKERKIKKLSNKLETLQRKNNPTDPTEKAIEGAKQEREEAANEFKKHQVIVRVEKEDSGKLNYLVPENYVEKEKTKMENKAKIKVDGTNSEIKKATRNAWFARGSVVAGFGLIGYGLWQFFKS